MKELTQAVLQEEDEDVLQQEDDSEINEERETEERNRLQENNSKLEKGKGEEARSDFFISQKEWIAALASPMPFSVVSHCHNEVLSLSVYLSIYLSILYIYIYIYI